MGEARGVGRRGLSGLLRERGGERQACGWAVQSWAKQAPARAALAGRAGGAGLAEALGRSGLGWGLAAWAGLVFYLTGFFSFYFSLSNSNSNKAI